MAIDVDKILERINPSTGLTEDKTPSVETAKFDLPERSGTGLFKTPDHHRIAPVQGVPEEASEEPRQKRSFEDLAVLAREQSSGRQNVTQINPNIVSSEWEKYPIRRVGGDNEEIRARSQSGWDLAKGAASATAGIILGGTIENTGYLFDWGEAIKRFQDKDHEFSVNWLSQIGADFQKRMMDRNPTHMTNRAKEGFALFDATWWSSMTPSIFSTLSLLAPVFAVRGLVGMTANRLGAAQKMGTRSKYSADLLGSSIMSRHMYSSLESRDVMESTLEHLRNSGYNRDEAETIAGQAASRNYRTGWWNAWKDMASWHIIFRGVGHANRALTMRLHEIYGNKAAKEMHSTLASVLRRHPRPNQAALQSRGLTKMDLLKQAGLEGFEEFNIQFQKSEASRYGDILAGLEEKGDNDHIWQAYFSGRMLDHIQDPHTWDATLMGFLGGAVFGGVGYAANIKMKKATLQREADAIQQEITKAEVVRDRLQAIAAKEAEGDMYTARALQDKLIFELAIAGLHDGTGKSFEGGLVAGRHEHNVDLFSAIEGMTPEELQSIQLDETAQQAAIRAKEDFIKIEQDYQRYSEQNHNTKYDDIIAISLTEQEFRVRKAKEYRDAAKAEVDKVESRVTDILNEISPIQNEIHRNVLDAEYAKQAIAAKKREAPNTANKKKAKADEIQKEYNDVIADLEKKLATAKNNIETLTKQAREESTKEQFAEETKKRKDAEKLLSDSAHEGMRYFVESANYQSYRSVLAEMQTPKWKKDTEAAIDNAQKEGAEKRALAAIENSTSAEELKSVTLENTSEATKDRYKERLKEVNDLQKELEKIDQTPLESLTAEEKANVKGHIDNIRSEEAFEQFVVQRIRDKENGRIIEEYLRERFDTKQRIEQENLERRLGEQIPVTDELSAESKRRILNKINAIKNPSDFQEFINEEILPLKIGETQKDAILKYIYSRKNAMEEKIQRDENLRANKRKAEDTATKENNIEDVKKGKKPPAKFEEDSFLPPEQGAAENTAEPVTDSQHISGNFYVGSKVSWAGQTSNQGTTYFIVAPNKENTVDIGHFVGPIFQTTKVVPLDQLTFLDNNSIVTEYQGNNYLVLPPDTRGVHMVVDIKKGKSLTGPDSIELKRNIIDKAIGLEAEARDIVNKEDKTAPKQEPEASPELLPKVPFEIYLKSNPLLKDLSEHQIEIRKREYPEGGSTTIRNKAALAFKYFRGEISAIDMLSNEKYFQYNRKWLEMSKTKVEHILREQVEPFRELFEASTEQTEGSPPDAGTAVDTTTPEIVEASNLYTSEENTSFRTVEANGKIIAEGNDSLIQEHVNGESIEMNPQYLANPNITEGTQVEFEYIETKYWAGKKEQYAGREHVMAPIFIVIDGQRVGLLKAADSASRKAIYDNLLKGKRVTAEIKSIFAGKDNFNNVRIDGRPRFMPLPEQTSTQWVKENGEYVKVDDAVPALVGTQGSIYSSKKPPTFDVSSVPHRRGTKPDSAEISMAAGRLSQAGMISSGNVYYLTYGADGNPQPVKAHTANIHQPVVDKIIEFISQENFAEAGELVNLTRAAESIQEGDNRYIAVNTNSDGSLRTFGFFSPSLQKIVQFNATNFRKYMSGETPGFYMFDSEGKSVQPTVEQIQDMNIERELRELLPTIKRQVDFSKVNNDIQYRSRLTGETYPTYNDYLFSEKEGHNEQTTDSQAIVSTDVLNMDGAVFHDPSIVFEKGHVAGQTTAEKITDTAVKTDSKPKTDPQGIPVETAPRVRTRKKNVTQEKIEQVYKKYASQLQEKNVSLENFQKLFDPDVMSSPEELAQSLTNENANKIDCL